MCLVHPITKFVSCWKRHVFLFGRVDVLLETSVCKEVLTAHCVSALFRENITLCVVNFKRPVGTCISLPKNESFIRERWHLRQTADLEDFYTHADRQSVAFKGIPTGACKEARLQRENSRKMQLSVVTRPCCSCTDLHLSKVRKKIARKNVWRKIEKAIPRILFYSR